MQAKMILAAALAALAAVSAGDLQARRPAGGQVMPAAGAIDETTPALDKRIVDAVARNIDQLRAEGRLPANVRTKVAGMAWPMGPSPGAGMDYHAISGYVDLNLAYPNQVRDYTCAARSYDTAAGYNHRGIDYVIWPFPWHLMDTEAVDVRAAAPGTLIEKRDGATDRSCSWDVPDDMNYVIILHADGTIARYMHLKRGSVTALAIGTAVAAGDFLGKVGSSGISKLPHLHFEVRASNAVNAPAVEPHAGQCNNIPTGWAVQRPYREPRINRVSTHSGVPKVPVCPDTFDDPKFKDSFAPGEQVTLVTAYRDLSPGQVTEFRILRPDNSAFAQWAFDPASDPEVTGPIAGGYWYWQETLPANAPHGLWTYEAKFEGQTRRHYFRVGNTTAAINDMRGLIGAWYEPATSGQGLEFHWIQNDDALVFFYGHRDDGKNFFALGQRRGRFDFGQEVEFDMYLATGGTFNNFDASRINRPRWGVLRLTIVSCTSAVAELEGLDGNKVMTLERLGRMPGMSC